MLICWSFRSPLPLLPPCVSLGMLRSHHLQLGDSHYSESLKRHQTEKILSTFVMCCVSGDFFFLEWSWHLHWDLIPAAASWFDGQRNAMSIEQRSLKQLCLWEYVLGIEPFPLSFRTHCTINRGFRCTDAALEVQKAAGGVDTHPLPAYKHNTVGCSLLPLHADSETGAMRCFTRNQPMEINRLQLEKS